MKAVRPALIVMKIKLKKYYGKTHGPYNYAYSIILNPHWKLSLFVQESWEKGDMEKYCDQCKAQFTQEYEKLRQSVNSQPFNEFDNYIQLPRIERKIRTLDWWRQAAQQYPKLALMARDYFAVPATGAGVE